jgi:hypothetical protein
MPDAAPGAALQGEVGFSQCNSSTQFAVLEQIGAAPVAMQERPSGKDLFSWHGDVVVSEEAATITTNAGSEEGQEGCRAVRPAGEDGALSDRCENT